MVQSKGLSVSLCTWQVVYFAVKVDRWVLVKENPCFQGQVHILYFCHQGHSIHELIVQTPRWQRTEVMHCKPGDGEPSLHIWLHKLHTFCAHAHQSIRMSLLQISHSWLCHSYSIWGLTGNSCHLPLPRNLCDSGHSLQHVWPNVLLKLILRVLRACSLGLHLSETNVVTIHFQLVAYKELCSLWLMLNFYCSLPVGYSGPFIRP